MIWSMLLIDDDLGSLFRHSSGFLRAAVPEIVGNLSSRVLDRN